MKNNTVTYIFGTFAALLLAANLTSCALGTIGDHDGMDFAAFDTNPLPTENIQPSDIDGDGIADGLDNCPETSNSDQIDLDDDGYGNACDPDDDGDSITDDIDNCIDIINPYQEDIDNDSFGNACDEDMDGDEIANDVDNCPRNKNPGQLDMDDDGVGNACDEDMDGDGFTNDEDNCIKVSNAEQIDVDEDGIGDACDGEVKVKKPCAGLFCKNSPNLELSINMQLQPGIQEALQGVGKALIENPYGDSIYSDDVSVPFDGKFETK